MTYICQGNDFLYPSQTHTASLERSNQAMMKELEALREEIIQVRTDNLLLQSTLQEARRERYSVCEGRR